MNLKISLKEGIGRGGEFKYLGGKITAEGVWKKNRLIGNKKERKDKGRGKVVEVLEKTISQEIKRASFVRVALS